MSRINMTDDVDVIHCCVLVAGHEEVAVAALQRDKFAIVEKPLTGYLGDGTDDFHGDHFPKQDALDHTAGQRAEADFGHIYVDFPAGRRLVAVLLVTWAHSYRPFAIALPSERAEAILHGMVAAFEFFGCVPRELWWDNPTTVATAILIGRQRKLHPRYQALASHYNFA